MPILFCQCKHRRWLTPPDMGRLIASLRRSDRSSWILGDLCLASEREATVLAEIAAASELTVLACSERAVRGLFQRVGLCLPRSTRFVSMRDQSLEAILRSAGLPASEESDPLPETPGGNDWVPWFPVLEHERCIKCGQCAEFCLFDVYDRGEDGVPVVARARNCKDNCPACARICPVNAIVFPKARDAEVAGALSPDELVEKDQPSVADILRKGAAEVLRQRRREQAAPSMVRQDLRKALEERGRCQRQDKDKD